MLRLRTAAGVAHDVPEKCTVEILDEKGKLAVVVLQLPQGAVRILTPGDAQFTAYCSHTKSEASKVHVHEPSTV